MPLLRRKPFKKASGTERLRDSDRVFFCEPTGEFFSNYEDYFHRVMLISSMVWSCELTGRPNLTYAEALSSEKEAKKLLKTFPSAVMGPFLLVATHTKRTAINEMHEDVYSYVKDHLFSGEVVDAYDSIVKLFRPARIIQVVPEGSPSKQKAERFTYHVLGLDNRVPKVWIVPGNMLKRDRSMLTRDKCKLFLKQHVEAGPGGLLRIKEESLQKYVRDVGLTDETVFFGSIPDFELSKKLKQREERSKAQANGQGKRKEATTQQEGDEGGGGTVEQVEKKKKQTKKAGTMEKEKRASGGQKHQKKPVRVSKQQNNSSNSETGQGPAVETQTTNTAEEMMRQKIKAEEEAIAKKQLDAEKVLLMQVVAVAIKKCNAVYDDQQLLDQRVMPAVRPVRPLISQKYFSSFVFILEFLNSFADLLSIRSKFPNGLTMDLLERALILREVNGPLSDIFQVLLGAIFAQQAEEENEVDVRYRKPENNPAAQKRALVPEQERAFDAAVWAEKHYCAKLHELPMDSTTVSELLRLHFLAAGALLEEKAAKHRYYTRGGFTSTDDPGMRVVLEYPHIIRALKSYAVYQLPVNDVIQLLCCLIHQLLTYNSMRELVEERLERARTARTKFQSNRAAQRRISIKSGSLKYMARDEMKKELSAFTGADGPDKENFRKQLQERMEVQCVQIEQDAQRQLKQLQAESEKLKEDFFDYQIYLGTDRSFRNYWLFESLPGLFVEHDRTFAGRCLDRATVNIPELANCATEARRKFITNSIVKGWSGAAIVDGVMVPKVPAEAEDSINHATNEPAEVYEQLLIRGSAELTRIAAQQPTLVTMVTNLTNSAMQQEAGNQPPKVNGNCDVPEDPMAAIDPPSPVCTRPPTNEELLMCTADANTCPVHKPMQKDTDCWGFFATAEELDGLIRSLNVRGVREKQLRETLECERDLIVTHIEKCPTEKLSVAANASRDELLADLITRYQRKYDAPNFNSEPGTEPNEILEQAFREHLLELEAKITVGYLGMMRVHNRDKWREAIESMSYDPQTDEPLVWGPKRLAKLELMLKGGKQSTEQDGQLDKQEQQQEQQSNSTGRDKDDELHGSEEESECDDMERLLSNVKDPGCNLPDTTMSLLDETLDDAGSNVYPLHESDTLVSRVQTLARALLQIEQCIDHKFLRHPFGPKKDRKGKNQMLQRQYEGLKNLVKWELSLMRSTSFSQLFLHHAVLYDAIQWSRSAERISCMTCRRKGDPDLTLLCDECNRACHIYCLKPKLKQVPAGDWFCMRCRPENYKVQKPAASSSTASAEAKNKKIFKWDEGEEEEEEAEAEDEEILGQEEEEVEEEIEEVELASEMEEKEVEEVESARDDDTRSDEDYGGRKRSKATKAPASATGGTKSVRAAAVKAGPSRRYSRAASVNYTEMYKDDEDELTEEENDEVEEEASDEELDGFDSSANERSAGRGSLRLGKRNNARDETSFPESKRSRRAAAKRSISNGRPHKKPRPTERNSRAGSTEKLYNGSDTDAVTGKRTSARSTKGRKRSSLLNGANGGAESSEGNESHGIGKGNAARRSRRTGEDLPLDSVALYTLIDEILKHPDSWPFNRPVSAKEVPDYYTVIKNPMDFARVKSKLNMGDYKINEQMLADVQLVFRNCDLYNTDETDVYRIGRQLERYVVKRCKELSLPFIPSDMQKDSNDQNGPTGASRKMNGVGSK